MVHRLVRGCAVEFQGLRDPGRCAPRWSSDRRSVLESVRPWYSMPAHPRMRRGAQPFRSPKCRCVGPARLQRAPSAQICFLIEVITDEDHSAKIPLEKIMRNLVLSLRGLCSCSRSEDAGRRQTLGKTCRATDGSLSEEADANGIKTARSFGESRRTLCLQPTPSLTAGTRPHRQGVLLRLYRSPQTQGIRPLWQSLPCCPLASSGCSPPFAYMSSQGPLWA